MMISRRKGDRHTTEERDRLRSRWSRRRILACVLGLGIWSTRPAWAGAVPSDPDVFTAFVADRIRKIMPGVPVTVVRSLVLDFSASPNRGTLYLTRLFEVCQRNPDLATTFVDTFVERTAADAPGPNPQPTRETLRVIIRPNSYVKSEVDLLAGAATPIARPLAGDFWLLGASDLPEAIKMLDSRDIARLGISADEAIAIGKRNMRPALEQTLAQTHDTPVPGITLISGDPYQSSLLAFPEIWAPLARASHGDLLVAAPAADAVLFADTHEAGTVAALRDAVETVMRSAERPLLPTIFRWSPTDWVVVPQESRGAVTVFPDSTATNGAPQDLGTDIFPSHHP